MRQHDHENEWKHDRWRPIHPFLFYNSTKGQYKQYIGYNYGNKARLGNILELIGRLSHYDVHINVVDTELVQLSSSYSSAEVYDYLNKLELLGLIKSCNQLAI